MFNFIIGVSRKLWVILPALCLLAASGSWLSPEPVQACSCMWRGPFLTIAKDAPLVVRGRILRHHPGPSPTMDVLVLETLAGGLLDSGLVVQMGDGMHCRPDMGGFPPGTEWVLAINGPGSKPGKGLAISHCGEYWLRVQAGEVIGSIDGDEKQIKRMPWQVFLFRFRYPRFDASFSGRVKSGERFRIPFGGRFEFILEPAAKGWEIVVRELGRDDNLARLTPPLHFAPNPREIEGWHLSETPLACTTRPHAADSGPENPRGFIFSPEVGRRIDGTQSSRAVSPEDVEAVQSFGLGTLTIREFRLLPVADGCPIIEWMRFSVRIEGGV